MFTITRPRTGQSVATATERSLLALLVFTLLSVPAVAGERTVQSRDLFASAGDCFTPEIIFSRQMSGQQRPIEQIIDDETQWCELWNRIHRWLLPRPECDTSLIDFETHAAVVIGLGVRPNLCYGLATPLVCKSPRRRGEYLISVIEGVPGPACACGMAIVQPLAVIALERPVERISSKHAVQVHDCHPPPGR